MKADERKYVEDLATIEEKSAIGVWGNHMTRQRSFQVNMISQSDRSRTKNENQSLRSKNRETSELTL